MRNLPRELEEALNNLTEPWELKLGSKHIKVLVNGHLAGILPTKGKLGRDRRSTLNLVSQIRRVAASNCSARKG